jgi:hypothetical protein
MIKEESNDTLVLSDTMEDVLFVIIGKFHRNQLININESMALLSHLKSRLRTSIPRAQLRVVCAYSEKRLPSSYVLVVGLSETGYYAYQSVNVRAAGVAPKGWSSLVRAPTYL